MPKACTIMSCPLFVVVVWKWYCRAFVSSIVLTTDLIIETSYFAHLCTYALNIWAWNIRSMQPFLLFTTIACPAKMVDLKAFIFDRDVHSYLNTEITRSLCHGFVLPWCYVFSRHYSTFLPKAKWAQVHMCLFYLWLLMRIFSASTRIILVWLPLWATTSSSWVYNSCRHHICDRHLELDILLELLL